MSVETAAWLEGVVSLGLGGLGVIGTLIALFLAIRQTSQLGDLGVTLNTSVQTLANTETGLTAAQEGIAGLSHEMYDVLGLVATAREDQALFSAVQSLTESYAQVLPANMPYITEYFREQLDELSSRVSEARTGYVEVFPFDITLVALRLIRLVDDGEHVFTTSYVATPDFWNRQDAKQYLNRSQDLIANHAVEVTRVFIFKDEKESAQSRAEMDRQHEAGIHVRVVFTKDLPPDLKRDMFLLENRLCAQYVLGPDAETQSVRIYASPNPEVIKAEERRQRLLTASDEYLPGDESVLKEPKDGNS
jgi:hypothetical protein